MYTKGSTIANANGMSLRKDAMTVRMNGGGAQVDGQGLAVQGRIRQTRPTDKGTTQQSPLFGILPKSLVSFWAADYLPNLQKLQRIATFVTQITTTLQTLRRLVNLMNSWTD